MSYRQKYHIPKTPKFKYLHVTHFVQARYSSLILKSFDFFLDNFFQDFTP